MKNMRKIALISALALSGIIYNNASAQVRVNVGFNLGGPVVVQRPVAVASYADDYYYLPEVDAYYSVGESMYYYNDGYNWIPAAYLPGSYRNYNWRNVRRVEVHAYRPYMNHNVYRTRYSGNQFDWRRFENRNDRRDWDNRNDRRDWDNRAGNNRPDWNRGNDNRPDWNDRNGRPDQRNDNRVNDNRGNGRFERPSQNDGRGRGNDNRPNFASNDNEGRRGSRS
jgi:hypothetical protein